MVVEVEGAETNLSELSKDIPYDRPKTTMRVFQMCEL